MFVSDSSNYLATIQDQWTNFYNWLMALNPLFLVPKSFHDTPNLSVSSTSSFFFPKVTKLVYYTEGP